jgi:hypothetical protein
MIFDPQDAKWCLDAKPRILERFRFDCLQPERAFVASHPFARKKAKGWGTEMVQE